MRSKLNAEKAIEVLLYTANRLDGDVYRTLKAIYHAEKYHLTHYGSQIYGEEFAALQHGPVPEFSYRLVKAARDPKAATEFEGLENFSDAFLRSKCTERFIAINRQSDVECLSQSDIESLDIGISLVADKTFTQVKDESHDAAYNATNPNMTIALETIASSLQDGPKIIQHLRRNSTDEFNEL